MGALADLWKSERGLLAILLVIGSTVLTALSIMTVDAWQSYTLWIFGVYAGSKTVTGAIDLLTASKRTATADAAADSPATPAAPATPATPATPAIPAAPTTPATPATP